ncbi:MAG: universal stress protein, partial [Haloplanus sp.]
MTAYVVGTDTVDTSAALCDYLDRRLDPGETVHAVNSLPGGDDTTTADVAAGDDAVEAVVDRLESHP